MQAAILLAVAALANAQPRGGFQAANATLHADVVKLVELSGIRVAIQNSLAPLIGEGKTNMLKLCTGCDPRFGDEWAKRMLARTNIQDFIDVYVRVYEKHFNDDEVRQLIASGHRIGGSSPPTLSNELKQKLDAEMVTIRSEIVGGTTQVGAQLGGEIGKEIQKEHPEYFRGASIAVRPFESAAGASRETAPAAGTQASQAPAETHAAVSFEDPSGIQEGMGQEEVLRRFGPPSLKLTTGPGEETFSYSRNGGTVDATLRDGKVARVRKSGAGVTPSAR
jgi:hypothetical protein